MTSLGGARIAISGVARGSRCGGGFTAGVAGERRQVGAHLQHSQKDWSAVDKKRVQEMGAAEGGSGWRWWIS